MNAIRTIAIWLAFLIVSLPFCFAAQFNLVYDANGNLVTGDGMYRQYNSLNQLVRIRNGSTDSSPIIEEYTYHPTEERVLIKKTYNNGNLIETVYYVDENLIRVVNSSGTFDITYVYHEGQLVAQQNPDGKKLFYHPDHLGSTTTITDLNGAVIENTSYTPYGEVVTGGQKSRYQYEGKEFDSKVKQYDFHFRGYKPEWGVFTQPDTLLPNVYDPQKLNRYMFERGNPWRYTDPTGHTLEAADTVGEPTLLHRIVAIWLLVQDRKQNDLYNRLYQEQNSPQSSTSSCYGSCGGDIWDFDQLQRNDLAANIEVTLDLNGKYVYTYKGKFIDTSKLADVGYSKKNIYSTLASKISFQDVISRAMPSEANTVKSLIQSKGSGGSSSSKSRSGSSGISQNEAGNSLRNQVSMFAYLMSKGWRG